MPVATQQVDQAVDEDQPAPAQRILRQTDRSRADRVREAVTVLSVEALEPVEDGPYVDLDYARRNYDAALEYQTVIARELRRASAGA